MALAAELISLPTDCTSLPTPLRVLHEAHASKVTAVRIVYRNFIVVGSNHLSRQFGF